MFNFEELDNGNLVCNVGGLACVEAIIKRNLVEGYYTVMVKVQGEYLKYDENDIGFGRAAKGLLRAKRFAKRWLTEGLYIEPTPFGHVEDYFGESFSEVASRVANALSKLPPDDLISFYSEFEQHFPAELKKELFGILWYAGLTTYDFDRILAHRTTERWAWYSGLSISGGSIFYDEEEEAFNNQVIGYRIMVASMNS